MSGKKWRKKVCQEKSPAYIKRLEATRKWYAENSELAVEISRRWRNKNRQKTRDMNNARHARKRGNGGSFKVSQIREMKKEQGGICVYCPNTIIGKGNCHIDHILPVALGGSSDISNIQLLCPTCNMRKSAKHPDDWHSEIGWKTP